jgi:hypothetical protein
MLHSPLPPHALQGAGTGQRGATCDDQCLEPAQPHSYIQQGLWPLHPAHAALPSPRHSCILQLWEKLTGQHVGPGKALAALEALFSAQPSAAPGGGAATAAGGAGPSGSGRPPKPPGLQQHHLGQQQLWAQVCGALPAAPNTVSHCTPVTLFVQVKGSRGGRACCTLLVVDEIDILITRDQSVRGPRDASAWRGQFARAGAAGRLMPPWTPPGPELHCYKLEQGESTTWVGLGCEEAHPPLPVHWPPGRCCTTCLSGPRGQGHAWPSWASQTPTIWTSVCCPALAGRFA